jgi:DNA-binding NtrC family response regulator
MPREPREIVGSSAWLGCCLYAAGMNPNPFHRPDPFESFVTCDPVVLRLVARLRSWAQDPLGVLLTGEAGVGKSLLGRLLHLASRGADASPFILCNPTRPLHLAHPWATLEEHGGTVVLDGLEHWSLEDQALMAHRLATSTAVPVRVVATSRLSKVRLGLESRLHPALAQHWAGREVEVPPLRARPDDLPLLVRGMLRRAGRESVELEAATWRALTAHGWLDNVRELRRVIDAALAQAPRERLEPRHLPLDRLSPPALEALVGAPFETMRREVDTWYLRRLLHETGDNLSEAARRSGCSRKVLRDRLRRYGLYAKPRKLAAPAVLAPSFAQENAHRPVPLAAEERVVPWVVVQRLRAAKEGLGLRRPTPATAA